MDLIAEIAGKAPAHGTGKRSRAPRGSKRSTEDDVAAVKKALDRKGKRAKEIVAETGIDKPKVAKALALLLKSKAAKKEGERAATVCFAA